MKYTITVEDKEIDYKHSIEFEAVKLPEVVDYLDQLFDALFYKDALKSCYVDDQDNGQ